MYINCCHCNTHRKLYRCIIALQETANEKGENPTMYVSDIYIYIYIYTECFLCGCLCVSVDDCFMCACLRSYTHVSALLHV